MFLSITDSGMNSHMQFTVFSLLLHLCIDVSHLCNSSFRHLQVVIALSIPLDTFILVSGVL